MDLGHAVVSEFCSAVCVWRHDGGRALCDGGQAVRDGT